MTRVVARSRTWVVEEHSDDTMQWYEFRRLNKDGSWDLRFFRTLAAIVTHHDTPEAVVDALSGKPVQDDDCDT